MPPITPRTLMVAEALLPAGVRGAEVGRVATTGSSAIELAADVLHVGRGDVSGELFELGKGPVRTALKARLQAGYGVHLLTDPETMASKGLRGLEGLGAQLEPLGGNGLKHGEYSRARNPRKVHAKLLHGPEASWLSTAAPTSHAAESGDVALELLGASRTAARAMTQAALDRDDVALVQAALVAANHGVLLNDAALGITHLTRAMEQVAMGARTELLVATKELEDVPFAELLGAAERRGVDVTLVTREPVDSRRVLRALGGVRHVADLDGTLHGNVLVADQAVATVGSAHATPRALGRASAPRLSHEVGAAIDDAELVGLLRRFVLARAGAGAQ